jgi:hypothetical protein
MSESKLNKMLEKHKYMSEFKDADKVIAYLRGEAADLPDKIKTKYDMYRFVQSLRMRYKRHSQIIVKLKSYFRDIDTRKAYEVIAETEYVFGKMLRIDREFEKSFMLEVSRRSIEIAVKSGNTDKITKALLAHNEILGPEEDVSDLPDFSAFVQHNYSIQLPPGIYDLLGEMLKAGALDLSKEIPSQMVTAAMANAEDVTDLNEEKGADAV